MSYSLTIVINPSSDPSCPVDGERVNPNYLQHNTATRSPLTSIKKGYKLRANRTALQEGVLHAYDLYTEPPLHMHNKFTFKQPP